MNVDVAVIGAGTAGLAAYRAAVAQGKRAVIIEGGPHGTTCARVGCMPSKLLIAAAEAAHSVSRFDAFGLRLDGAVRVDGAAVMRRVKRERDRFVGFVLDGVERIPAADKVTGRARFISDHTLRVQSDAPRGNVPAPRIEDAPHGNVPAQRNEDAPHGNIPVRRGGDEVVIRFKQAVIATGSTAVVPKSLRELGDRVAINDDVFAWDDLPKSVAILGPGVIGLELGQALHRLGVNVSMFGLSGSLGSISDPDVYTYALATFRSEFELDPAAKALSLAPVAQGVEVSFSDQHGARQTRIVERVIAATGRAPNVRDLGLENTTLELDAAGVPRFDRETMRCGLSNIFIAGDANQDVPVLHEAADEGRFAGENAARFPQQQVYARRSPLAVVFTDPQIAMVGKRWAELAQHSFVTGAVSFEDQGRSRVMLRNKGVLRVYADSHSGRFLGAEMFGPDAEHIGHLLAWAHQNEMTIAAMLAMPFYHPVVEEGLRTALRDAQAKLQAQQNVTSRVA